MADHLLTKNRLLHWTFVTLLGAAVFMCAFFLYSNSSSEQALLTGSNQSSLNNIIESKSEFATPTRLQISKIGVEAEVESVGLTPQGAMDTPANQFNVAWYNRGPRPGEQGSAVIDGHLDGENQSAAVFKDLDKLEIGDIITVVDEQNRSLQFKVRGTKLYQAGDDTTEVFENKEGRFLNLITCAGKWNQTRDDYEERLVIFSELITN